MNDFKLIFRFLRPYKLKVSLSLFCHVLMALFTIISIPLIIPLFHFLFSTAPKTAPRPTGLMDALGWLEYYFVKLIDTQGPSKALIYTCLFLMLTFFFKNLFRYLAMYFMIPVRSSVVNGLRTGLYDSYLQMGYNTRNEYKRGDLLTRMTVDVQEVEYSILRFIEAIFKSPILILGSVLLMLSIHKGLTLFVFVLMLFTLLVIGTLSKTLKKSSTQLQSTLATLTGHVDESLDGLQMLNIFRVTDTWRQKFDKTNRLHKDIYDKVTRRQELSSPVSEFLGVSVVICLLWYGAQLVFAQELKPAAFFAFVFAFYHVIEPLKSFSTAFYNIKKGSASLERINSITAHSEPQDDTGKPFRFNHRIEFENVGFSYGAEPILNQVSFIINQGEKMALVGNSGSGKSTIISLLLKIIKPQEGRILIDGVDLSEISKRALYEKLGLVSQSPFLYNASLRDNLTLGRQGLSDEVLWEGLSTASAKAFVSGLEAGLDTVVGDRGEMLSGGERQRITIARALLEDPTLLIFDEPTSALDPAAERKVSLAIINAMQERTALIVAHRLSTIQQADRIMFLEKGKVIEQGTHQELIAQEGRYNEYVNMQTLGLL